MPKILNNPKENILNAVRQELKDRGTDGFNIRDVAVISGVAVGTIYNYFGKKGGLIRAVAQDDWAKQKALIEQSLSTEQSFGEKATAIFQGLKQYLDQDSPIVFVEELATAKENYEALLSEANSLVEKAAPAGAKEANLRVLAGAILYAANQKEAVDSALIAHFAEAAIAE